MDQLLQINGCSKVSQHAERQLLAVSEERMHSDTESQ